MKPVKILILLLMTSCNSSFIERNEVIIQIETTSVKGWLKFHTCNNHIIVDTIGAFQIGDTLKLSK